MSRKPNQTGRKQKKQKKSKKNQKQKFSVNLHNWNTTDADEILRRQIRADNEKFKIENKDSRRPYFSAYFFSSSKKNNKQYAVEIRSLDANINSCNYPDYRVNHLGTCKHIEAVLKSLRKKALGNLNKRRILVVIELKFF